MSQEYNIYCDESCHLEHDNAKAMVVGAIWCEKSLTQEIFKRIRNIKQRHGFNPTFEIKWTKISPAKLQFYKDIIDYYFDNSRLCYRAIIVPDKSILDHEFFNQTHDEFYYKLYFNLIDVILEPVNSYNIYFDIKDTQSQEKVEFLRDVLRSSTYDFDRNIIKNIQQVRSHEVELIQLTDLMTGALSYIHRGLRTSEAKLDLIEQIRKRSGYELLKTTLLGERKMNILRWNRKRPDRE